MYRSIQAMFHSITPRACNRDLQHWHHFRNILRTILCWKVAFGNCETVYSQVTKFPTSSCFLPAFVWNGELTIRPWADLDLAWGLPPFCATQRVLVCKVSRGKLECGLTRWGLVLGYIRTLDFGSIPDDQDFCTALPSCWSLSVACVLNWCRVNLGHLK